jgi:cold shock CspA family protein
MIGYVKTIRVSKTGRIYGFITDTHGKDYFFGAESVLYEQEIRVNDYVLFEHTQGTKGSIAKKILFIAHAQLSSYDTDLSGVLR